MQARTEVMEVCFGYLQRRLVSGVYQLCQLQENEVNTDKEDLWHASLWPVASQEVDWSFWKRVRRGIIAV